MQKKVTLPFEYAPYSLMYHENAFLLGIIQGNATEDITPWLSGKYINCWFNPAVPNKFDYNALDTYSTQDKILSLQRIDLYADQLPILLGEDILDLFRSMLNMGFYPHGSYNEEYIPGKWSYQKKTYKHDFVLTGYDDIQKEFISAGYLADGKFQRFHIPYENMRQAIATNTAPKLTYRFWKYNQEASYELNMNRLILQLKEYLGSITTMKVYTKDKSWGMKAISDLAEHYATCGAQGNSLDIRYTRGLMEHKYFMELRVCYLLKQGYCMDERLLEVAKNVYELSQKAHMLGLKYNMTGRESIVRSICDIIRTMQETETGYLPLILKELEAQYGGDLM